MIDLSTDEGMREAFREIASWTPDRAAGDLVETVPAPRRAHSRRPLLLAAAVTTLLALVATALLVSRGDHAAVPLAGGTWSEMSATPLLPRRSPYTVWTGTELLVIGGFRTDGTPLGDGAAYSPATNTWRPIAPMPAIEARTQDPALRLTPLVAMVDDEAMVVAPTGSSGFGWTILAYRPATDSWRVVERNEFERQSDDSLVQTEGSAPLDWPSAIEGWQGKLVAAGTTSRDPGAGWAVLDAATGAWSDYRTIPASQDAYGVVGGRVDAFVVDDRYFVALGSGATFGDAGALIDLTTGRASVVPFPGTGDDAGFYWSIDRSGTAVGVALSAASPGALRPVSYRFDAPTGGWETLDAPPPGMGSDQWQPALVDVPGGHVLFGGLDFPGALIGGLDPHPVAAVADDRVTRWSSLPDPPIDPERIDPVLVWTGSEVLVWGGWTLVDNSEVALNDGALYRPSIDRTP